MTRVKPHKRLKKELRLRDVYAIATGATLSAGFFLLPGIAAIQAGPALILAYILAAVPLIPAMFSVIELSTAMPRAGGVYYFLDRALGPGIGTIGGIGTWLALILKVAFALVGMGAYIRLFFPELQIVPVAVTIAFLLGGINVFGAKKSGGLQVVLVSCLLTLLALFFTGGLPNCQIHHFDHFLAAGWDSILSTAGLVYISYVGMTKVASLSEEVEDPERNLPRGVFLALGTAFLVYVIGTTTIVGLVPPEELRGNLTPVATAARYALGQTGVILLSIAALLAFISVANAGMMSASRYPLAMSRDHLLPTRFRKLSRHGTPVLAIALTLALLVSIIVFFDPIAIAKLASAFQLLMFALVCGAVIVMRESQLDSYDPGYRSPLYPWMQIAGMVIPVFLIVEMGRASILFSAALLIISFGWYLFYGRRRVSRNGAIYHVFERLGRQRYHGLDTELRGILKEKGLREDDPFDDILLRSQVVDLQEEASFEAVLQIVAAKLQHVIGLPEEKIVEQFMVGTRIGATPVTRGVALPHFRSSVIEQSQLVLVRARSGVRMTLYNALTLEEEGESRVMALFFLVSPENNPTQHLRILARIAERVDEESFVAQWQSAHKPHELKEAVLQSERFLTLPVHADAPTAIMIGQALKSLELPTGCLVAFLGRGHLNFVPNGNTVIQNGDSLTVIGEEAALKSLRANFLPHTEQEAPPSSR
ncbi:MAG: amino acid permease [Desulfuromonadaceae bacterium]|nr:amino acid permease [Desulfuromonadaceae bacterium]